MSLCQPNIKADPQPSLPNAQSMGSVMLAFPPLDSLVVRPEKRKKEEEEKGEEEEEEEKEVEQEEEKGTSKQKLTKFKFL